MRTGIACLLLAAACHNDPTYIVEGTVLDLNSPTQIVVNHEAIAGYMPAMIMPFDAHGADVFEGLHKGDRIVARLRVEGHGLFLERVRVTGSSPPPPELSAVAAPLHAGEVLAAVQIPVTGGETWTVGAGQGVATAVGFVFTTCPNPAFCPATILRMQALQEKLPDGARILLVTIDPTGDTLPVLEAYAAQVGAKERWRFGRLESDALRGLAERAALTVDATSGTIVHATRLWVLDAKGALVERYDDNRWPLDRVVTQLATGEPAAPVGSDGTMTAE